MSGLRAPRKVQDRAPVYPDQSLRLGDEGAVVVELQVRESGHVSSALVLWSGCHRLDAAALRAVKGWRFEKVTVNGRPASFNVTAVVPFHLPEPRASRPRRADACQWVDPPSPLR
jgi:protein TonB